MFDYQAPADLLKDRVILVTGASDGIGRALAVHHHHRSVRRDTRGLARKDALGKVTETQHGFLAGPAEGLRA